MMCHIFSYKGLLWADCYAKLLEGNLNSNWAGYAKLASCGPHLLCLVSTWWDTEFYITEGLKCQLLIINHSKDTINHSKDTTYYHKWNLRSLHNDDLCKLAEKLRGVPSHASRSWRTHALENTTRNNYCNSHNTLAISWSISLISSSSFSLYIFFFSFALHLNFTLEEGIMGGDLVRVEQSLCSLSTWVLKNTINGCNFSFLL